MSPPTPEGIEVVVPTIVEREVEGLSAPAVGEAGDWLCSWCLNRVANEKDRFQYDGKDEFAFSNPERIRFAIITFSQTLGCRETGAPTLEHTWFPGHAWSYCLCAQCGQHVGWYYSGQHEFAGLIKARILRALYLRN